MLFRQVINRDVVRVVGGGVSDLPAHRIGLTAGA